MRCEGRDKTGQQRRSGFCSLADTEWNWGKNVDLFKRERERRVQMGEMDFLDLEKKKRPINWYTTKTGSIRGGCNRRCNFCQRRASVAKPTPDIGLWLTAFPKIDAIDFRPSVAQLRDREKGGETCGGVSVLVCVSWSTHPMKINCPSSSGICTGQIHYSRSRFYFSLGRVQKVIL